MSADWARQRALELIRDINGGGDPAADLKAARIAERERQRAPTVERLVGDWIAANASAGGRARSTTTGSWADRHVLPVLGRRKAHEVEPGDVRRWYRDLAATGQRARRRTAASPCSAPRSAGRWRATTGRRSRSNPCHGAIARERQGAGAPPRALSAATASWSGWSRCLRDRGDLAAQLFLFLLLSGARVGEASSARWAHFDLDAHGRGRSRATATKQKRPHRLPLNAEAAAILRELKAGQPFSPFGALGDGALRKAWVEVLRGAGITDLRVHDLRHWHACLLAGMGMSPAGDRRAARPLQPWHDGALHGPGRRRVAQGDGRPRRAGRPRGAAAVIEPRTGDRARSWRPRSSG